MTFNLGSSRLICCWNDCFRFDTVSLSDHSNKLQLSHVDSYVFIYFWYDATFEDDWTVSVTHGWSTRLLTIHHVTGKGQNLVYSNGKEVLTNHIGYVPLDLSKPVSSSPRAPEPPPVSKIHHELALPKQCLQMPTPSEDSCRLRPVSSKFWLELWYAKMEWCKNQFPYRLAGEDM